MEHVLYVFFTQKSFEIHFGALNKTERQKKSILFMKQGCHSFNSFKKNPSKNRFNYLLFFNIGLLFLTCAMITNLITYDCTNIHL